MFNPLWTSCHYGYLNSAGGSCVNTTTTRTFSCRLEGHADKHQSTVLLDSAIHPVGFLFFTLISFQIAIDHHHQTPPPHPMLNNFLSKSNRPPSIKRYPILCLFYVMFSVDISNAAAWLTGPSNDPSSATLVPATIPCFLARKCWGHMWI